MKLMRHRIQDAYNTTSIHYCCRIYSVRNSQFLLTNYRSEYLTNTDQSNFIIIRVVWIKSNFISSFLRPNYSFLQILTHYLLIILKISNFLYSNTRSFYIIHFFQFQKCYHAITILKMKHKLVTLVASTTQLFTLFVKIFFLIIIIILSTAE